MKLTPVVFRTVHSTTAPVLHQSDWSRLSSDNRCCDLRMDESQIQNKHPAFAKFSPPAAPMTDPFATLALPQRCRRISPIPIPHKPRPMPALARSNSPKQRRSLRRVDAPTTMSLVSIGNLCFRRQHQASRCQLRRPFPDVGRLALAFGRIQT